MQRELLKQERMYNERVSDRNQILVWLGLFGLLIPAYAIYAVCGARSVAVNRPPACPQPLIQLASHIISKLNVTTIGKIFVMNN